MAVYQSKKQTADGRGWFFKTTYTVPATKQDRLMVSKKYSTKEEALQAEHDFLIKMFEYKDVNFNMTFGELFQLFLEFKKGEVKFTTYQGYLNQSKHIQCFMNTKCVEYSLPQFEAWKSYINSTNFVTRHKNDLLKFWKSILNYGTTYHGFNFSSVYRRMTNFTDPNERKKEMKFYTVKDFKKFLAVEDDFRYRCLWKTLFFCGLRCGEARGLMWECVDFENRTISINKQVHQAPVGSGESYVIIQPKTKTSVRKIPIVDKIYYDLLELKNQAKASGFYSPTSFVFGTENGTVPYNPESVRKRSRANAKASGLEYIRLHDFRHSCASLLINSGANVTMVAKYLGHSEIEETLNTYSHMFPNALDDVISIINKLKKENENVRAND